jgi:hypothetical protein
MRSPELPDELRIVEACLGSRRSAEPRPDLRPRVLAAMQVALERERATKRFWRCAAAIAAAAVMWINFASSAINHAAWPDFDSHDAAARDEAATRQHVISSQER